MALKDSLLDYKKYFDLKALARKIESYEKNFNSELFLKAFKFAEKAHQGQMRKDGATPYIVHPIKVVEILADLHADFPMIITAIMHDVPEDTEYQIDDVKDLFGEEVAFLVNGVTKLSKVQYRNNMPEREVESLKKMFLHTAKDPRVSIIKIADRLHNMKTLDFVSDDKQIRIAKETLEIYVPMANLLGLQLLKRELEDLCFKYIFPTEYKAMEEKLESVTKLKNKNSETIVRSIRRVFKNNKIEAKVSLREPRLYNIYRKLCKTGRTIEDVDDRLRIRITVNSVEECYQALGLIYGRYIPKTDRFRDFIANPKVNGYQSLHTVIFSADGLMTEIKIQTFAMCLVAEYGIAAKFFEKNAEGRVARNVKDEKTSWMEKIERIEESREDFLETLKYDVLEDRIFVFTPRGETIDLPKGASAIDFAYAIHSEIGVHASRAKINGKNQPITNVLRNGDVVNIFVEKDTFPELYWLNFTKTNLAKSKIKDYLKESGKVKKLAMGKKILQKEFDIAGLGLCKDYTFKKIQNGLMRYVGKTFQDWQEVFLAIGGGEIKAGDVVNGLIGKVRTSKNIQKNIINELLFEDDGAGMVVSLRVLAKNRSGLLKDISEVLYRNALDLINVKAKSKSFFADEAIFKVKILVSNLAQIGKIFDEIEQIDGVTKVHRVNLKGLVLFYSVAFLASIIWAVHPFLLSYIIDSSLSSSNQFVVKLMIYLGIFMLLFTVLFLTNVLKRYFPIIRGKNWLWITSFALLTLATVTISMELFYLQFDLSWVLFTSVIVLLYVYLGINYFGLKKNQD